MNFLQGKQIDIGDDVLVLLTRDQTKLHQVNMNGDSFALSCKTPAGKKKTLVTAFWFYSRGLDQLHQVSISGVHSPYYASVCREEHACKKCERIGKDR